MGRRRTGRSAGKGKQRRSDGRVTLGPCDVLGDDRVCEPLNHVVIDGRGETRSAAYSACSCGRRFRIERAVKTELADLLADLPALDPADLDLDALAALVNETRWPIDAEARWARLGVAPVGTPALHHPTREVGALGPALDGFADHMLAVMDQADGIGLAANQVAVPLRVLAHNLPKIAPMVLVNAELVGAHGAWRFAEGCLSLELEGTNTEVIRPNKVWVRARLLDGSPIALLASELFGRVLQHEIDHLDGIEYVQRLTGQARDRVYARMKSVGIDLDDLPPRPYDWSAA